MILRRAIKDTLGGQLTALFVLISGGVFGLVFLYITEGIDVAAEEVPYFAATVAGAAGAMFLLFCWNFICAPYRIEKDAHLKTKAQLEKFLSASSLNRPLFPGG